MQNTKTVLVPDFMKEAGVRILRERNDIRLITYPMTIAAAEFQRLLPEASAVALAATR
ncbi:MAG: hypothetical protein JOZ05_07080, partial [Acetobacteraceae bacterium]|nr:hypothetical protein [Acetobacteraceae bacterium]